MIRCIAFDFDGTLVHSNAIKRDGMLEIAACYPDGLEIMTAILADPPGDRHAILASFAVRVGADGKAAAMVETYGRRCSERVLVCPTRRGAETALKTLRAAGLKLYINSATPSEPLHIIIKRRYGLDTFDGVFGGHGEKAANLREIMKAEGAGPRETVMVGDGIDDRDAARETGVHFFGIAGGTLSEAIGNDELLNDLGDLPPLIASQK